VEYAARTQRFVLDELVLQGAEIDLIHGPQSQPASQATVARADPGRGERAAAAAQQAVRDTDKLFRVGRIEFHDGTFGWVDRSGDPNYRLFLSNTELVLADYDNQRTEGRSTAKLDGKFMGSGPARLTATFGSQRDGPEFDAAVAIEPTPLTALNGLLRARGNFDVVGGQFSLYSQVRVRSGQIRGYVKPLFKDPDVYDSKQDRKDSVFHKIYEGIVGGIGTLLRNEPEKDVATVVDLSGNLEDPHTSTLQVVSGLLRNALVDAILPGFERSLKH
jgi:hypothetical protein